MVAEDQYNLRLCDNGVVLRECESVEGFYHLGNRPAYR
jgi:hypothetical protein